MPTINDDLLLEFIDTFAHAGIDKSGDTEVRLYSTIYDFSTALEHQLDMEAANFLTSAMLHGELDLNPDTKRDEPALRQLCTDIWQWRNDGLLSIQQQHRYPAAHALATRAKYLGPLHLMWDPYSSKTIAQS